MNMRKFLVKLNNRFESSWVKADLTAATIRLKDGWYITEFIVAGSPNHTPRLVIARDKKIDLDVPLNGFHSSRNRMLLCLPDGELKAHSQSLELLQLARVSTLEGRARVLLICLRYLIDFFSIPVLLRMIGMQFQNRFDLSKALLSFYSPVKDTYLQNVNYWNRFRGFNLALMWLSRGAKIAVLIEHEEQRARLEDMMVPPDYILKAEQPLPSDTDYVLPLNSTERLRDPAILMLKRALKSRAKSSTAMPTLVYTDHDYQFDEKAGQQAMHPVFKPSASQVYLHCFNYLGPAVLFAVESLGARALTDLLSEEGRYQQAIECFTDLERVMHVSEVLFTSTQQSLLSTPPPHQPSAWPNIDWVRRGDANALIASSEWQEQPSVDLIIPTRDGLAVLKPCIESLLSKTDYPDFHIIIVDNGSEKAETLAFLEQVSQRSNVKVVAYPGEFNYSAINNFAVAQGSSEYVALINNDIEVIHADWLTQMMAWAVQPDVGIVGAKLLFGNGSVQHAGVTIGMGNAAGHIHRLEAGDASGYQNRCIATQNMMAVTAACLVTPRALYEQLGGLNESDFKVAYNDIDYCLRVEARKQQVIWTPQARLYHHESVSRGDDMSDAHVERYFRELAVLQKKWHTKGFVDKYYSKHLRISDEGVYPQIESSEQDELIMIGD